MIDKMIVSKIILYILSSVGILMSLLYLLTPNLLPFHINYIGKTQKDLDQRMVNLLLFAFKIIGGCFLAIHISIIFLIIGVGLSANIIRWTVLFMLVTSYLPILIVALKIKGPWWLFLLGLVLAIFSFFLSINI